MAAVLGTFGVYWMAVKYELDFRWGLVFRAVALLGLPALSDDFYRFVFDGRLAASGLNPYLILPELFFKTTEYQQVIGDEKVFQLLNSPNYYTVYPPLNQFIFKIAALISGKDLWLNVFALRIIVLLFEVATCYLLNGQFSKKIALLYAFNPLIIIELTGNLHFEGIMIFFLLLTFVLLKAELIPLAGASLGFAVATKLLPLIFLPLIWAEKGWAKALGIAIIAVSLNIALASFFYDPAIVSNFKSSLGLYFQKFEFNASVYYLLREFGYWWKGYNIIQTAGKVLMVASSIGILTIAYFRFKTPEKLSFYTALTLTFGLYLLLANTVHPWYVSTVFVLSILAGFRFGIIWSGLVFLTYHVYETSAYHENLWFVLFEYLVVFFIFMKEIKSKNYSNNNFNH
jgi:alpha-1,6-mannosyltransferase